MVHTKNTRNHTYCKYNAHCPIRYPSLEISCMGPFYTGVFILLYGCWTVWVNNSNVTIRIYNVTWAVLQWLRNIARCSIRRVNRQYFTIVRRNSINKMYTNEISVWHLVYHYVSPGLVSRVYISVTMLSRLWERCKSMVGHGGHLLLHQHLLWCVKRLCIIFLCVLVLLYKRNGFFFFLSLPLPRVLSRKCNIIGFFMSKISRFDSLIWANLFPSTFLRCKWLTILSSIPRCLKNVDMSSVEKSCKFPSAGIVISFSGINFVVDRTVKIIVQYLKKKETNRTNITMIKLVHRQNKTRNTNEDKHELREGEIGVPEKCPVLLIYDHSCHVEFKIIYSNYCRILLYRLFHPALSISGWRQ